MCHCSISSGRLLAQGFVTQRLEGALYLYAHTRACSGCARKATVPRVSMPNRMRRPSTRSCTGRPSGGGGGMGGRGVYSGAGRKRRSRMPRKAANVLTGRRGTRWRARVFLKRRDAIEKPGRQRASAPWPLTDRSTR